jgi:hypothetical protein
MKFLGGTLIFFGGLGTLGGITRTGLVLAADGYDHDNNPNTPNQGITAEQRARAIVASVIVTGSSALCLAWGLSLWNGKK